MLLNSTSLRSLYTGFSTAFQGGFSGVSPLYQRVAQTVPSSTRSNEYGWLGEMPRIREWVGDRVINNIAAHRYTISNRSFESTVGVDRDDIDDDNIGIYAPLFSELGRNAATFPDELVWALLKVGFSTLCYDGQYFFDTDHPVLAEDGQTVLSVSNTGGGSGAPWFLIDASRAIKPVIYQERRPFSNLVRMDAPTDEVVFTTKKYRYGIDGRCNVGFGFWQLAYGSKQTLDATSYEAARVALGNMKGDHGRPLGITPNLLIVPPALEGSANAIVKSVTKANGATNEWAGTAEVLTVPWLS
ncbi:MAG: Mu-like prophage major head subunit gpT family protein [Rhizobiales bacterium]|nr:Mu-like prophage major head subunit gpT family protein [Hyphomicrobiales bacterium]